jgi:hypothetical protein
VCSAPLLWFLLYKWLHMEGKMDDGVCVHYCCSQHFMHPTSSSHSTQSSFRSLLMDVGVLVRCGWVRLSHLSAKKGHPHATLVVLLDLSHLFVL